MERRKFQDEKYYIKSRNPLFILASIVFGIFVLAVFSIVMQSAEWFTKLRRWFNALRHKKSNDTSRSSHRSRPIRE
ncbi:MAG: hypothetical protein K0S38_145 [Candidatus Paceibacter sp.]|jgi:hypothetical protein|nr:hypothetical protein [Candidatus Paceibacter sp.]